MTNDAKRSRKERVLEKAKQLIVIVSYLWVFLSVLQLHRAFILAEHKIQYSNAEGLVFALINAWVLGKFVLIGESLFAGARWHSQPLLYLILYKSAVCGTILIVCNILEGMLSRIWRAKSFAAGLPELSGAMLIDRFSMALIAFVVLIPFFTAREFKRVLGKSEFYSILWGRREYRS